MEKHENMKKHVFHFIKTFPAPSLHLINEEVKMSADIFLKPDLVTCLRSQISFDYGIEYYPTRGF